LAIVPTLAWAECLPCPVVWICKRVFQDETDCSTFWTSVHDALNAEGEKALGDIAAGGIGFLLATKVADVFELKVKDRILHNRKSTAIV
jgi:hypothetical protein